MANGAAYNARARRRGAPASKQTSVARATAGADCARTDVRCHCPLALEPRAMHEYGHSSPVQHATGALRAGLLGTRTVREREQR